MRLTFRYRSAVPNELSCGLSILGALGLWIAVGTSFAQTPAVTLPAPNALPVLAPEVQNSAMDGELFYQIMVGELNVVGGEPGAAYSLILDAARKTRDANLYERAIRVALQARSGEPALQAARAWKQALPASREANRYILQVLLGLNRLSETLEPLKSEIATSDPKDRAASIAAVPTYFARSSDKKAATSIVEQALGQYLGTPQYGAAAWAAVGRMRLDGGDSAGALEAASKAQAADPRADGAVLIALSLIGAKLPQAEQMVRKYLDGNANVDVRMDYARVLLDAQRYAEAAEQLRIVTTDKPDHPQAWLVQGTLELQDKKIDAAEKSFKRHMEISQSSSSTEANRGLVQAYLSMSQIAEQRKDLVQAESWLNRIDNADDMIIAQSRRAAILAKQGKLEEGRKLLRNLPEKTPEDARQKVMAEVQLLRDNKQYKSAYELVAEKAKSNEDDYELLYDKAMLAEKLGRLDEMERLLRAIIAAKPDYQHAYNALGYSLAERKLRLPEARALILKALELAPNDPFITDSLGWVEFQSGNLPEALRILQGAFQSKPDAEIAAHLGEVLWVSGKREQALTVWREGVALNAESETLVETLKRLRVKP
jgi:tetratricopeptide (TPR) repeat protein